MMAVNVIFLLKAEEIVFEFGIFSENLILHHFSKVSLVQEKIFYNFS